LIAIILNSGIGKRMGELTSNTPKCLVKLSTNETILGRQLRLLDKNGISDIIITTGPFEEKIRDYLGKKFPHLNIRLVNNPLYTSTNYIYSIHLIPAEYIQDDVLLMHGDLVFDNQTLNGLIKSPIRNAVIINPSATLPAKDFKGKVINGIVTEIGVDVFGEDCFFLIPLYKMTEKVFSDWIEEIRVFVSKGKTTVYAEDAFNEISQKLRIQAYQTENELCMEIDTREDLQRAMKLIEEN